MKKILSILMLTLFVSLLSTSNSYAYTYENATDIILSLPYPNCATTFDVSDDWTSPIFDFNKGTYGNYLYNYQKPPYDYVLPLLEQIENKTNDFNYFAVSAKDSNLDSCHNELIVVIENPIHTDLNDYYWEYDIEREQWLLLPESPLTFQHTMRSKYTTNDLNTEQFLVFILKVVNGEMIFQNYNYLENSMNYIFDYSVTPTTYNLQLGGTPSNEWKIYRNTFPVEIPLDESIEPLSVIKTEVYPDYTIQTIGENITISLDSSTLNSELDENELGYSVTISKLNDDLSHAEPIEEYITDVDNLDSEFTYQYPLSKYLINVKLVDKNNLYSNKYDFKSKPLIFNHDGSDKVISSKDYEYKDGEIAMEKSLSPNSFKNLIKISFSNPFKPLFDLFKTGNTCANVPIIAGMLHAPSSVYCSWFSSSTRNIITPVMSISSLMLIFGYFIRWLSGHSGDNTINLGDQYTGFFGRRFK